MYKIDYIFIREELKDIINIIRSTKSKKKIYFNHN